MLKHERGQYKKIEPKLNKQSRQSPIKSLLQLTFLTRRYAIACASNKSSDDSAHLRKCAVSPGPLLFAFITYVHLEDVDAQPTLVFIACANNKNSNESAQSRYIHNIWKTQTQSRRRFFFCKSSDVCGFAQAGQRAFATQYIL